MEAFIPIIGPALSIITIASWEIIKLLFVVSGNGPWLAGWAPWISLCVWGLAF